MDRFSSIGFLHALSYIKEHEKKYHCCHDRDCCRPVVYCHGYSALLLGGASASRMVVVASTEVADVIIADSDMFVEIEVMIEIEGSSLVGGSC